MPRLKKHYSEKIIKDLTKEFDYSSVMQVPKVVKITLNKSIGVDGTDKKLLEKAITELKLISGQHPVVNVCKKSVAAFKTRKGSPFGCKVTLRRSKMYEFLDRFINITLPRMRDFRGIKHSSFDGNGNLNFGIEDSSLFFELPYDSSAKISGFDISIATSAKTDKEAIALLKKFNLPIN